MRRDRRTSDCHSAGSLRRMLDAVAGSLDEALDGEEIAQRARFGRYHLDHQVKRALGESTAAVRRRLLLERAAYRLSTTDHQVFEIALGAHYSSLEAFTRAFRRAFGAAPSVFRSGSADFRLPAPNGVHYHPPAGADVPGGRPPMDLIDRVVEHSNWLAGRLLEAAAGLDDQQLDEPVRLNPPSPAFAKPSPSIREMLDRLVLAKEMWAASIAGRPLSAAHDASIDGMLARLEDAADAFVLIVADIRHRDAWDTAYLDALREPPETTTFGAAVAHLLAWDAVRRGIIAGALRAHGVETVTLDPISWERGTMPPDEFDGVRLPDREPPRPAAA